jgi:hypothetical protein
MAGDTFGVKDEQQALALRDELIVEVRPIQTDDDRQQANAIRLRVKDWLDRFGVIEKDICDPVYKAWKNAKERFKEGRAPAEAFLSKVDAELQADRSRQLAAQAREQQRQNDLAQKRIERAQASGRVLPIPVAVAPIVQDVGKKIVTESGAVTWVDNYVPQIVDETKIPREYLMPDMKKLAAACKAGIEVPGVLRVNQPFQRGGR